MPIAGAPFRAGRRWQIARCECSVALHLLQNSIEIRIAITHLPDRIVFVHRMRLSPILEQRPAAGRHNRSFMSPLLRVLAPAVDEVLKLRFVVCPQTRPKHKKMCRYQDVDVVELQQTKGVDNASKMSFIRRCGRPFPVESLSCQRNAPRFSHRKSSSPHLLRCHAQLA